MSWASTPYSCYSVEFSPFRPGLLCVGAARYYGIVGSGMLHVFDRGPNAELVPVATWQTNQGVFDTAWSESNEEVLLSGHGDGTIALYDFRHPGGPVQTIEAHQGEVHGVDWNLHLTQLVSSASWDHTVKVWDAAQGACLHTFAAHRDLVYAAAWAPSQPAQLASVGGDGVVAVCDIRSASQPELLVKAHHNEILTVDWNKYRPEQVVTGSVDKTVRLIDIRNPSVAVQALYGHRLAVRRVKCHPHSANHVATGSYDMSVGLWDLSNGAMEKQFGHHTEFVQGIDLCLFEESLIASVSWDRTICVWNTALGAPPPRPPDLNRLAVVQT